MKNIGEKGQKAISETCVALVGCGGLGSPNAFYLAALGVKKIILIDNDKVEVSNLNRQILHDESSLQQFKALSAKEKVEKLNSNVEVEVITERLTELNVASVLSGANIIIDAVDNVETRYMLDDYCNKSNKPVVFAAIEGFQGTVYSRISATFPEYSKIFPYQKGNQRVIGVVGCAVGTIGSIQCTEVLKWIIGETPSYPQLLYVNLLNHSYELLKI